MADDRFVFASIMLHAKKKNCSFWRPGSISSICEAGCVPHYTAVISILKNSTCQVCFFMVRANVESIFRNSQFLEFVIAPNFLGYRSYMT